MAGAGLITQVLVGKFCDHLPIYRQSQIYAREGVVIERSKLAGRGTTRTARLWVYARDDRPSGDASPPAVWFQYSPDRKGEHPRGHLAGFAGTLQADAFAGYDALFADGQVVEAACWAHARRKYYEIHKGQDEMPGTLAHQALLRIGALYAIEKDIRGQPAEERRHQRQSRAKPLVEALHGWLQDALRQLSAKSSMAQAIGYSLNHWHALTRFVNDGHIEMDNNAAERALRAVVLGRKNYLHFGSDAGGERAAVIYTLIGSCKLGGIDPQAYLHHVLGRIADHPINRIDELLPWRVAEQLRPAWQAARQTQDMARAA